MTKEEQVVGLIFQVAMWAYIAAAAAYVVIGRRHDRDLQPVSQRDVRRLVFDICFAGPSCQRWAIR